MVKEMEDYLDQVHERFPQLTRYECKRFVQYGLKMYSFVNNYGCDVLIKDDSVMKYTIFTGNLGFDSLVHYQNGLKKWGFKERLLYRLKGTEWNGYYYFGLTQDRFDAMKDKIGRKRTPSVDFGNLFFYQVFKEITHNHALKHIFRVKYEYDCGLKFYLKKYKSKNWEYLGPNNEETWEANKKQ